MLKVHCLWEKTASEVDKRLQLAKDDLKIAQEAYNTLSVK